MIRIRFSILFCAVLTVSACNTPKSEVEPVSVIAFGSCDHEERPEKLWAEILLHNPDVFIWGGDIMYGDSPDMEVLREKYNKQKNLPDYQALMASAIITGTYDDHDYGVNDGGKYFAQKKESRNLLFEFLDLPAKHEAWQREGAYHKQELGPPSKLIKILNLDTRYFRDTLERPLRFNPETGKDELFYLANDSGDVLGEAQWAWLEKELTHSNAKFHIINSSIQVLSAEHRFEKWANFPTALNRLLALFEKTKPSGLLLISGDRHIAEVSQVKLEGLPYPLVDFTSSGLTHTWSSVWPENNKHRVGDLVIQRNFGLIHIDWERNALELEVRGKNDTLFLHHRLQF
ncbi:MAG: alkaline phosphatase D family protein [Luteibaculaceae bacterium]